MRQVWKHPKTIKHCHLKIKTKTKSKMPAKIYIVTHKNDSQRWPLWAETTSTVLTSSRWKTISCSKWNVCPQPDGNSLYTSGVSHLRSKAGVQFTEQSHDARWGNKVYGAAEVLVLWRALNVQKHSALTRLTLMETFQSTSTYLGLTHTSETYLEDQSKYFLCSSTHFWRGKDGLRGRHNKSLIVQFGVRRMSLTQALYFPLLKSLSFDLYLLSSTAWLKRYKSFIFVLHKWFFRKIQSNWFKVLINRKTVRWNLVSK